MITNFPSNFANAIAPFAPLGGQAVGEENTDLRATRFKPVEQLANAARSENRRSPDENVNEAGEQDRLREAREQIQGDEYQQDREQRQATAAEVEQQKLELEQQEVRELAARDREVRAHEQAHAAVGGRHAGSPVYEFVRGPDGVSYAVGGEVSINTSPIPGNPEATIAKAQQIRRAASAPAEPSAQDRRVAAEAAQMEVEARVELRELRLLESQQKAEQQLDQTEAKQIAAQRKEELAQMQREQREQQERERARRAEFFLESSRRNIDINRRLIDIGVINTSPAIGSLFNKIV